MLNDEQKAEQKVMKELIAEHAFSQGMSLVFFLSQFRRVGEPIGDLIERVYKAIEKSQKMKGE